MLPETGHLASWSVPRWSIPAVRNGDRIVKERHHLIERLSELQKDEGVRDFACSIDALSILVGQFEKTNPRDAAVEFFAGYQSQWIVVGCAKGKVYHWRRNEPMLPGEWKRGPDGPKVDKQAESCTVWDGAAVLDRLVSVDHLERLLTGNTEGSDPTVDWEAMDW
jgi:hypothetical protein